MHAIHYGAGSGRVCKDTRMQLKEATHYRSPKVGTPSLSDMVDIVANNREFIQRTYKLTKIDEVAM